MNLHITCKVFFPKEIYPILICSFSILWTRGTLLLRTVLISKTSRAHTVIYPISHKSKTLRLERNKANILGFTKYTGNIRIHSNDPLCISIIVNRQINVEKKKATADNYPNNHNIDTRRKCQLSFSAFFVLVAHLLFILPKDCWEFPFPMMIKRTIDLDRVSNLEF